MATPLTQTFDIFNFDPDKKQTVNWLIFAKAGDELGVHSHSDHGHCSIVVKGSFEVFDHNGVIRVLKQGDNIPQFTPNRMHGFRALEDGSILMNIGLPGK